MGAIIYGKINLLGLLVYSWVESSLSDNIRLKVIMKKKRKLPRKLTRLKQKLWSIYNEFNAHLNFD